jgi:hypothetical protein
MMARLKLTDDNYYSQEANWEYMSASQFKSFRKCEAAAMAELRGEWGRKESSALLVGSYVDAYFSNELEQFKADHPELYKRDGSLKAEFQNAHAVAERLNRDELARMLLSGRHQVIKTGRIAGVWYKTKADSLLTSRQVEAICKKFPQVQDLVPFGGAIIVDLKCMKDFKTIWDEETHERVSFIEYWGYDIQGAIYQKVDNRMSPFVIVGVTKEAEPDIIAVHVPGEDLSFALDEVEAMSPRYAAIKKGEIAPVGCGTCAYCRSVKRLEGITHYKKINVLEE